MQESAPLVVLLMGPTATGKTDAALGIADRADVALVSVDSAMVYRRMDIGTAKPSPEVLRRHPHALVDVADPAQSYSVAQFVAAADAAVRAALRAGRTPLLVGGSMLYFRAFRDGINAMPSADPALRERIGRRAASAGWPALHRQLQCEDPAAAARIDPRNGARIQRALEVLALSGRSITDFWAEATTPASERLGCELLQVAIVPADRALLHRRIGARLDAMLRRGLVEEVRRLRDDPRLNAELPSMRSVGYAQVWRHLAGDYGHAEMVQRIAAATRQVAKRQLSWLGRWPATRLADADSAASHVLQKLDRNP